MCVCAYVCGGFRCLYFKVGTGSRGGTRRRTGRAGLRQGESYCIMSSGYQAAAQSGTGRPVGAPTKRLLRGRGRRSGGDRWCGICGSATSAGWRSGREAEQRLRWRRRWRRMRWRGGYTCSGMAVRRGSVGGSKCSAVVAVESAVVSVSMLAQLSFLDKVCREWWLRRRRSRKERGLERP